MKMMLAGGMIRPNERRPAASMSHNHSVLQRQVEAVDHQIAHVVYEFSALTLVERELVESDVLK